MMSPIYAGRQRRRVGMEPNYLPGRVRAMLVFMQPGASPATVDAVRRRATEVGLETALFDGIDPGIVLVTGDNAAEASEEFLALPGVSRVVCADEPAPPVT